ncbi:MAG: EAL domain-containing protein, partial [Cyanobacteria bacterium P01_F01_bin.143]
QNVGQNKQLKYGIFLSNIICCFFLGTTKSLAQDNILVIHSYHSEFSWTRNLKEGIDESFSENNKDINVFHEFLDAKRYPNLEHGQSFLNHIRTKYQNTNIDILMVSDDPGLDLILNNKNQYFANIPLVFLGINHVQSKLLKLPQATGVFENRDIAAIILEAQRQTNSNQIIVINDSTQTGQANLRNLQECCRVYELPQQIKIIDDLEPQNIKSIFEGYSENIPVLLLGQLINSANGELYGLEKGAEILRSQIPNPIYGFNPAALNHGIIGGKFLEGKHHAEQATEIVKNILQGSNIENIKPIIKADNRWIFDAKELKKFNIELEYLPNDSEIINLESSFYEKYKSLVWLTSSAFMVTLLIIALLIQIIRKGETTKKILRENKSRYKDLAEAGANIFWEIDPSLKFCYVSGDTQNLYNKNPQEILGKSLRELFSNNPDFDFPWNIYKTKIEAHQPLSNLIFKIKQQHRELKIFQLNGKPIYDQDNNFIGYRGIQREITEEYNLSQTIAYQASYDSLTGLINRREFNKHFRALVDETAKSQRSSVLCFLDLDRFKLVNDTAGHLVGDCLLGEVASLLQSCIRKKDVLGRLGGDEFGLLLIDVSISEAQKICQNIINHITEYRFQWNNRLFDIGISIGIISINNNSFDATELLSKADLACYKAKDLGRGRFYVAGKENAELNNDQMQMEYIANVSQAIEQEQFYLSKQLIQSIDPQDKLHQHYEILLRYQDQDGKIISPGLFIPAAEKYGVITIIDRWVLETVVTKYKDYFPDQKTILSVNLSGISISNQEFINFVTNLLSSAEMDLSYLCLEITETAAISQLSQALEFISTMRKLGVRFALDDFGSGVSSFSYLKDLPIDYLKIDGSLIKNIVTEPSDRAIVDSISCIAQVMGIKTIAEFVENDEILQVLAEIGVDYAQGYGIGKPIACQPQVIYY